MNSNWRTNLGGALGALGSTLVGVGVVPQLGGTPNKFLTYVAISGFFISASGKFFTALFAADAKSLGEAKNQIAELQLRSNMVPNAIESSDTTLLRNTPITPVAPPSPPASIPPVTVDNGNAKP